MSGNNEDVAEYKAIASLGNIECFWQVKRGPPSAI